MPLHNKPTGVTSASTDTESGTEGTAETTAERQRSLRALEAMRARGLLAEDEFQQRRAELLAGQ